MYLDDLYANLISRPSETASVSGFDDEPQTKPCEHRLEWQRGGLCLGCDNTDWRRLTTEERRENMGIDPYAADVKCDVALVESSSSKKARAQSRVDTIIAYLERDEKIRSGDEAMETVEMRNYRIVANKHSTLRRIIRTLEQLKAEESGLYRELTHDRLIALLARITPGQIHACPVLC